MADTNLLAELDQVTVSPEVATLLNEHVIEIASGSHGRRRGNRRGGMISLQGVRAERGALTIDIPQMSLPSGNMVVLVGRNGVGKTTFLDALMGIRGAGINTNAGSGVCDIGEPVHADRTGTRISRLNQEELLRPIAEASVRCVVREVAKHYHRQLDVPDDDWLDGEKHEGNVRKVSAQQRIENLCGKVVVEFRIDEFLQRRVCELSGGERTKLSLLLMLLSEPDIALFDEPTNHLDVTSIAKLTGVFQTYRDAGVLMVSVSHVPTFLRQAGRDQTVVITRESQDHSRLTAHRSAFAKVGRHLEMNPTGVESIDWCDEARVTEGALLADLREATIGESPLRNVSFPGPRCHQAIVLLGENGSGKTKLMEHLVHDRTLRTKQSVSIAYLPQFWPEEVTGSKLTIDGFFEQVRTQTVRYLDAERLGQARNRFLSKLRGTAFSGSSRPLSTLSGGEQRLLWFLAVSAIPAVDMLVLDEPTNHMDEKMRAVVARGIEAFIHRGAVLVSTHDLDLLRHLESNLPSPMVGRFLTKRAGVTSLLRFDQRSVTRYMEKLASAAKRDGARIGA
ncbi:MAG: ABC-F family ATP-binding cassette domain-containing protein [Lentisphaerae bacterium]|jgi:ATPase subunit of ABC transporter with duplicated ATPase domains|nr:ABC-F family ATP-binding cassette domain-containing protein [Lentisphaerota bacterium]MBT4815675.1 ABC-F family ATP-binding cassette domain-containing protein [Lentisphaerota bacterium]MBT5612889.1 ABC-F family ATP-binding cassette domain-containing protein [Lentisphaerota bacterium]MBT7060965.1 ABC-F family ATP-binding cassette domain-containing protein [Lentisphaerota bacterium]MBT7846990.1 ABC-F family ATP-binding cassette domain-containing protein [Lentisphaerota bacterium]